MESIAIPKSVTCVGERVFDSCDSLTDVYYGGSKADRAAMDINEDNACLLEAEWHYAEAEVVPTVSKDFVDLAMNDWGNDVSEGTLTIEYDGDWDDVTDVTWMVKPITEWYVGTENVITAVHQDEDGSWYDDEGDLFDLGSYLSSPENPFTFTATAQNTATVSAKTGRCDADLQTNALVYAVLTLSSGETVTADPVEIHLFQPWIANELNDGEDLSLTVDHYASLCFGGSGSNSAFNAVAYVWSEDTTVAQVNNDMTVKGIAAGNTVIHYDWYYNDPERTGTPALTYTVNVEVTDPDAIGPAAAIDTAQHVQLLIGDDERSGMTRDLWYGQAGMQLMNVPVRTDLASGLTFTYTVDDPTLLSVDSLGRMTALTEETTTVQVTFTVTGGGDSDTVTMTVQLNPVYADVMVSFAETEALAWEEIDVEAIGLEDEQLAYLHFVNTEDGSDREWYVRSTDSVWFEEAGTYTVTEAYVVDEDYNRIEGLTVQCDQTVTVTTLGETPTFTVTDYTVNGRRFTVTVYYTLSEALPEETEIRAEMDIWLDEDTYRPSEQTCAFDDTSVTFDFYNLEEDGVRETM